MGLGKSKPFRSKEFMKFLHERRDLVGDSCAVCLNEYWTQLHHFGCDGGKGMKPSDLYLVRVCPTCADENEIKMRALYRDSKFELLSTFLEDAMNNVEAWLKYRREHRIKSKGRILMGCPRDEAFLRLMEYGVGDDGEKDFNAELDWWLSWVNRQCDNINGALVDALQKIVQNTEEDSRYIAQHVLLHNGVGFIEPGEGDRDND